MGKCVDLVIHTYPYPTEDKSMRNIDDAINQGLEIVKSNDDIDLDIVEMMDFYDRFLERDKTLPLYDAITRTLHDAFLAGVAFSRQE